MEYPVNHTHKVKEKLLQAFDNYEDLERSVISLMNNIPGIVYRGLPDWSVTFMGADVERITGYTAEEFISGKVCWRDLIYPEDLDRVRKCYQDAVREKERFLRVEYRFHRKDGSVFWIEDRRQLIYDEEGTFVYVDGLGHDITKRMHTEEVLEKSEERYRSLVENIDLGVTLIGSVAQIPLYHRDYNLIVIKLLKSPWRRCL